MFIVFDTVQIVYICVFMTSSTYCLCDTFSEIWNVCIYVCMLYFGLCAFFRVVETF